MSAPAPPLQQQTYLQPPQQYPYQPPPQIISPQPDPTKPYSQVGSTHTRAHAHTRCFLLGVTQVRTISSILDTIIHHLLHNTWAER